MTAFPNFTPLSPYAPKYIDNAIRNDTEGGYGYSRPKYTNLKKQYDLNFLLTDAQAEEFDTFVRAISLAGEFTFSEPLGGRTITCFFLSPPVPVRKTTNIWELSVSMREK